MTAPATPTTWTPPRLGVNIDHVATLRQARRGVEPDPVWAAAAAELGGADGITVHLREDRRHIQDRDLRILRETVQVGLNLELAVEPTMLTIALQVRPDQVTLVPERREEVTTEGGLAVSPRREKVGEAVARLREAGIRVATFLDPDPSEIDASVEIGVDAIELHTGRYADAPEGQERDRELEILRAASARIASAGIGLHAGHGLNYRNVMGIAGIAGMAELNIGHAIVCRAVFVGLEKAVREMRGRIEAAR
ncbi:pyridoxine 5'-phosphate synthase [Paludisphaera soli]|uniref:pyridoxine 5'-phosphate synthase n=1 Tax=Paludisphaera soli TaxID=2712865 RepID=UPI0013EB4CA0|nr:pyridoxine 5'-phosphate synthase [Paludisphaera soli]